MSIHSSQTLLQSRADSARAVLQMLLEMWGRSSVDERFCFCSWQLRGLGFFLFFFILSWVVLIKLCCRTSERRLMDAQEVWQLWEDAGQSGPAAICSLSFTALLMEKQTKQQGSEPADRHNTHTHTGMHTHLWAHTAKHKASLHMTEMRGRLLSSHSPLCVCKCRFPFFFSLPFSEIKLGASHSSEI